AADAPGASSAVARRPASHETGECRLPSNRMRKLPWTGQTVRTVIRESAGSLVRAQRAVQRSDRLSALILAAYATDMETVPSRRRARARRVHAGRDERRRRREFVSVIGAAAAPALAADAQQAEALPIRVLTLTRRTRRRCWTRCAKSPDRPGRHFFRH